MPLDQNHNCQAYPEYWFSWGFNFWNRDLSDVSMCLYTCTYSTFLFLELILHRIRQICLKVPSPKFLTCTNLLFLNIPVYDYWYSCDPNGFNKSFSSVSLLRCVGSDLIFTALWFYDPVTLQPGASAHCGCCVGVCHQTNLFMIYL